MPRIHSRYSNPFGLTTAQLNAIKGNPFVTSIKQEEIKPLSTKKKISKPKNIIKTEEQLAEELNSNEDYNWTFRTSNGAVNFKSSEFPSCCGVGVVSRFSFGNIREGKKEEFYKEIKEYIINSTSSYLNRASILFSDAVGGEYKQKEYNKPHVHEMCQSMGLKESGEMFNPRTGHQLVIFTLTKEVKGIYRQFEQTENGEVVSV